MPHHVTQRGNRRQETFFRNDDFQERLEKKFGRVLRRQKSGPKKDDAR